MLSDEIKEGIVIFFAKHGDVAREIVLNLGPRGTVDRMLNHKGHLAIRKQIAANRAEAEQIIAGILGLM